MSCDGKFNPFQGTDQKRSECFQGYESKGLNKVFACTAKGCSKPASGGPVPEDREFNTISSVGGDRKFCVKKRRGRRDLCKIATACTEPFQEIHDEKRKGDCFQGHEDDSPGVDFKCTSKKCYV